MRVREHVAKSDRRLAAIEAQNDPAGLEDTEDCRDERHVVVHQNRHGSIARPTAADECGGDCVRALVQCAVAERTSGPFHRKSGRMKPRQCREPASDGLEHRSYRPGGDKALRRNRLSFSLVGNTRGFMYDSVKSVRQGETYAYII